MTLSLVSLHSRCVCQSDIRIKKNVKIADLGPASCCVDSDVILPTEPNRLCYSFAGWAVTSGQPSDVSGA